MKFSVKKGELAKASADVLLVGVHSETSKLPAAARALDRRLRGAISAVRSFRDFSGKPNEMAWLPPGSLSAKRVLVIGLGKTSELDTKALRESFATASRACSAAGLLKVALDLPGSRSVPPKQTAEAVAEGMALAGYDPGFHKTDSKKKSSKPLTTVSVIEGDTTRQREIRAGLARGAAFAAGTNLARDLVNQPSNELTPTRLAEEAKALAAASKTVRCRVWGPRDIERHGMGGLMGVGRGSAEPSQFIQLEYKPPGSSRKLPKIAFVGKGLTFDTGGISIKPAQGMELMKFDMGGAAAVLGGFKILDVLQPSVHVLGYVAAAENMPDGKAIKPGDLLHMMNGMTVEVNNTDAEGRLVLADALHYAKERKPDFIVDAATLTGACMIALGDVACGLMTEDDELARLIEGASQKVDEAVWRMPLVERHRKIMEGHVADLKNTGPREGGALTAAGFLSYFVKGARWAHLDIAGMVWVEEQKPVNPKGATGYGARLFAAIAEAAADGAGS